MHRFKRAFHVVPPCSSYKLKSINYKMSNSGNFRRPAIFLLILLILTTASPQFIYSYTLTLDTDQEIYCPGEVVLIKGIGLPETEIQLIVNNSETILNVTLFTNLEGKYNYSLQLEENTVVGNYSLIANSDTGSVKTQIQIIERECYLYHTLDRVIQDTRIRLLYRIDKLSGKGESVKELQEKLEEGDFLYEEAYELLLQGNCQEANQKLIQVLNQYGEGYTESESHNQYEPELGSLQELRIRISRAYNLIIRLNKTLQHLEEKGYKIGEIQNNLESANSNLTEAEEYLENEEVIHSEEKIELAEEILAEVLDSFKEITNERKKDQAKSFIENTEQRMKQMKKILKELLINHENPEEIKKLEDIFNKTIGNLKEITENLEQGDINNALDELSETLENNENEVKNLDFEIKELNRLEKIQELLEKIQEFREENYSLPDCEDKTNIESFLKNAEIILQSANESISDEGSDNLIEEADEIIEKVEEIIEECQENQESNIEKEEDKEDDSEIEDNDTDKNDEDIENEDEDNDTDDDKDIEHDKNKDNEKDKDKEDNDDDTCEECDDDDNDKEKEDDKTDKEKHKKRIKDDKN